MPLIASSSLNLQVTYSSFAAAGVEGFVLLLPPIIGGALGTALTSSDYDRRLRGIRHLLMLAAALGLYRVIIDFVIFKTFS